MNLMFKNKDKLNSFSGRKIKKQMNLTAAIAFFLVAAVLLVHFQTFITNGSLYFSKDSLSIEWQPVLLLLNALPLFVVMCFLYFAFGSVNVAFSSVSIIFTAMLVVNFLKVDFRAEPFIPTDITTIGEAANVSVGIEFKFTWVIVVSVFIMLLANILMWIFVRSDKVKAAKRICGIMACMLIGGTSYFAVYSKSEIFNAVPSFANIWKDSSVMENKGFLYMFLNRFGLFSYDAPEGYSKKAVEEVYSEAEASEKLPDGYIKPDVIAIMGESYFDIKKTNLEYENGFNPTENLEKLRQEGAWGELIVRGIGGGTVVSEFEFLTANVMPFINDTIISPYNTYITKDAYSIVSYLKDEFGYESVAMHLGNEWFYNRKSTYPRLGFDRTLFYEDVEHKNLPIGYNGYAPDSYLADEIIDSYNKHISKNFEQGYFNFNVTVANHLPYNEYEKGKEFIKRADNLSDSEYLMVNRYAELLGKTDELLGRVYSHINASDKPTVLVFFGDHLPNWNQRTLEILPKIGIDTSKTGYEGDLLTHSTPYLILGNDAFKKQAEKFEISLPTGKQQTISSNCLGIKMLEYMNIPMSAHFSFAEKVQNEVPVISNHYYITKDGSQVEALEDENQRLIDKYKIIQYYGLLKYNK